MPSNFPELVHETAQMLCAQAGEDDDEARYMLAADRQVEAEAVATLVDAFVAAEMFRTHAERGLGVYGPNLVPPVGDQIAKRLRGADGARQAKALEAVKAALAVGYVGFISVEHGSEITVRDEFDLPGIWALTVTNFRAKGPEELGLPKDLLEAADGLGQAALIGRLKEAELVGFRKTKVGFTGRYYARAGLLLRAGQTTYITDEGLRSPRSALMNQWPYETYVKA